MTGHCDPADDRRLRERLQAANAPLESDAFVGAVMRRVRGRLWIRRSVLGAAFGLGLAVAFPPLADLATQLAAALETAPTVISDPQWVEARREWLALLAMPLLWPVVRWLAR